MVKLEGVLDKISNLEKAVNTIQASISSFNEKVKKDGKDDRSDRSWVDVDECRY